MKLKPFLRVRLLSERLNMKSNRLLYPLVAALFAAICAVCAQIIIPLPSGVPLTLQTLAVCLSGAVLGVKWGIISTLCYILMGAVGVPVFSSFSSGFGVLFGPTGGFIFGFLFLTVFCALAKNQKKAVFKFLLIFVGVAFCHLTGIIQYSFVSKTPFLEAFLVSSSVFIPKDIISAFCALFVANRIYLKF